MLPEDTPQIRKIKVRELVRIIVSGLLGMVLVGLGLYLIVTALVG